MSAMTRRRFLQGSSALALAAAVGACGSDEPGGGSSPGGGGGGAGLNWWDHFSSFQKLHADWAAKQSEALGTKVTYTYYEASKAPEALQLANQAKALPDVYSNVVGIPLAALVKDNWVHELEISQDVLGKLPKGTVTEGITSIDDKLYGLPLFSFRQYTAVTWFNTDHFAKAGLDPNSPPTSYDQFREACQKLKAAGIAPMTLALGADGGRVRDEMDDMAQTGGFDGYQGLNFTTGEYAYHDDAYVNGIEFWKELYDSGLMLPGTNNFSVVNARTRFASGSVGFFIDGPWCPGGSNALQPAFLPKMGGGQILTAETGATVMTYRRPSRSHVLRIRQLEGSRERHEDHRVVRQRRVPEADDRGHGPATYQSGRGGDRQCHRALQEGDQPVQGAGVPGAGGDRPQPRHRRGGRAAQTHHPASRPGHPGLSRWRYQRSSRCAEEAQ